MLLTMNASSHLGRTACVLVGLLLKLSAEAQVLYTDSFNVNRNYLTNGVSGSLWDGVYFGAREFNNSGLGGGGPGATLQCDANLTTANTLTVQTTGTAWEGADDDGFFLFKTVPGDFSVSVRVVSPFNTASYNTAGLLARAFSAEGGPLGGSEDYVSWARFDQYGFANYLRNEVNGAVAQINPGNAPNSNYWLRLDRVNGTNFYFYEKSTLAGSWQLVSFPAPVSGTVLRRPDLVGQPMQVGIMHATFNNQIGVQFTDFRLSVSNVTAVASPSAPTGLTLGTNFTSGLNLAWTPGAGSAGSVVVVWPATNSVVKEMPANGFSYTGNASYGLGSSLPATGYFVVHVGAGNQVTVNNLAANTRYNVAVFSYAGAGSAITYNRVPVVGSVVIPPNTIWAQLDVESGTATLSFSANAGKWYWLQSTPSLNPANWQNALPEPVLASSPFMNIADIVVGPTGQQFFRLQEVSGDFTTQLTSGGISSLRFGEESTATEFISGGRLGNVRLKYRPASGSTWYTTDTATPSGVASTTYSTSTNAHGVRSVARYQITNGLSGPLSFESVFDFGQDDIRWTLNLTNLTGQGVVVGDLALPFPMNTTFSDPSTSVFKHSFISGHGSWIFWMRPDSVGPYLTLTPADDTKLEYWDRLASGGAYEAYIHSQAAGELATAQGSEWRQANTSLSLLASGAQTYGFKFRWADDYDAVREVLVEEGKIDVQIAPGMTVPTNLFAQFALRTTQTINSVSAEFPATTQIQYLGANGPHQIYQVQFTRLGENQLTVNYGNNRQMFLEFFVTEPLETLITKRSQFLVAKQINDTNKWYNGLYAEWNMASQTLVTPDNYDLLVGFVRYEVAADDSGLSRPAYMAVKNAVLPVQSEVTSLDHYIQKFVWGGLQRTTNETYAYGIYGVQDWYSNRNSANTGTGGQLHIWRIYDYPHIVAMYEGMYRVAKYYPQITTALTAQEYLRRAYHTAVAMFTVPLQVTGWSAYQTGLMNELVIEDIIRELEAEGMTSEAAILRGHWEQKVNYFVLNSADLFGSEYSFDSTGFETQQALARYGLQHASSLNPTNPAAYSQMARQFMERQMAANLFCRGWLETAYYHYGSDFRQQAGDWYTLSYMAQMGGWGVQDYALYYATNPAPYVRLAYGSYLSAWALMNTGTPASNYGFWYPGAANDGACGGGFEPSPYNTTWLGQPCRRGSWYYSCEQNLGFCGAVRMAATVLSDDEVFGRFCYGGNWSQVTNTIRVSPQDGVRQQFHAMLSTGQLHLRLMNDRFTAANDIVLTEDLSSVSFVIETPNPAAHSVGARFSASIAGAYTVSDLSGTFTNLNLSAGEEVQLTLPMGAGVGSKAFFINR
jgi:hypothetical protein